MAVKRIWGTVKFYEKGSPSYTEHAGQWLQTNLAEIYEAALMTGGISPANFGTGQTLIPCLYRLPDPLNCLIPAFDIGRTQPHTFLQDWVYTPRDIWVEIPPVSQVDAQVLFCGAFLPDLSWRLSSKFLLEPNEPFAFAIILNPAVRDNLTFPYVKISWGNGEWAIYLRPELEPQLWFRGKAFNIGSVFGEIWHSSPLWRFEGAVGSIIVLPVRGHLVIGNARQWQPLNPQVFTVNPYILGKSSNEPIHWGGQIEVEGRGASCFFAFPSVDFTIKGEMFLPRWALFNVEGQTFSSGKVHFRLSKEKPFVDVSLPTKPKDAPIKPKVRVFGVQRHEDTVFTLQPVKIEDFEVPPDEEIEPPDWLPEKVQGVTTAVYKLSFKSESSLSFKETKHFFELVTVALYTEPQVKEFRKPLMSVPIGVQDDISVRSITIDVSEEDTEALIEMFPNKPSARMPILSTDLYCEATINVVNWKGKMGTIKFKGFVEEVTQTAEEGALGAVGYRVRVKGVHHRLMKATGDQMFPPFDGKTVSQVLQFLFQKVGLIPSHWLNFQGVDWELTPQLLWEQPSPEELPPTLLPEPPYSGFPYWWVIEKPRFTLRLGQSLWDFIKELCRMTGNDIYVDLDWVWVVPTATEATLPIHSVIEADKVTDPRSEFLRESGAYLMARAEVRSETGWMPTTFVAIGKNVFGAPITFVYENSQAIASSDNDYFRGYRVAKTIADDKLTSYFLLYRAALTEFLKVYSRPPIELRATLLDIPFPLPMLRSHIKVLSKLTDIQELKRENLVGLTRQNEWTIRRYRLNLSADLERCNMEIVATPPAYIPTGVILPR